MPADNDDLHGMAPDRSDVALLLIDVINDLEWEGADQIVDAARDMAERIAALRERADAAGIPVIYANDNYGIWRSDFQALLAHCLNGEVRGRFLAQRLAPRRDDYFVLKPKHSAFFSTTLDVLLRYLGVNTLVLCGLAGNICILFTANDAYMRDFALYVPADCVASNTPEENRAALEQLRKLMDADIRPGAELDLGSVKRTAAARLRNGERRFTGDTGES